MWLSRELELVQDEIDDAVQEVVLVGHVVVERHRLDAERITEPAHGEAVQTFTVRQLHGRAKQAISREGRPGFRSPFYSHLDKFYLTL